MTGVCSSRNGGNPSGAGQNGGNPSGAGQNGGNSPGIGNPEGDESNSNTIALGVGLGVGVPLVVAAALILRRRQSLPKHAAPVPDTPVPSSAPKTKATDKLDAAVKNPAMSETNPGFLAPDAL